MNNTEETSPRSLLLTKIRARVEAIAILGVGIFGMVSTFMMNNAGGSKAMNISVFPRLIYALMIIAGIGMLFSKNRYAPPKEEDNVSFVFLVVAILIVYAYFIAILNIGIICSTFIFLMSLFVVLTKEPKKEIGKLLLAGALGTAIIWAIYVLGANIFLPKPLLF